MAGCWVTGPRSVRANPVRISTDEAEGTYRLLGADRGLSEVLINLSRQVGAIDWPRLREARSLARQV